MIFGFASNERPSALRPFPMAQNSIVMRQWHTYFTEIVFRRLVLSPSCIPSLDHIIQGKGSERSTYIRYIRHIWLRIELPEYHCDTCLSPEDWDTMVG